MRRLLRGLLVAAAFPTVAAAAPVTVLEANGHAVVRNDPFVVGPAITPAPPIAPPARPSATASAARRPAPAKTMTSELARLDRTHQLTRAVYRGYNARWNSALATERRLRGVRQAELEDVISDLHTIAADGALTASRLPALFDTLARNQQWWTTGPLLTYGQRVEFAGSGIVWEFYPGQGIQLQVLGSFGKADGLYTGGPADYPQLRSLLAELIPLAANRAGGLTWEYYFNFDGGQAPWTSAMSQGTAIEALTRAYEAFQDPNYLALAHEALPVFAVSPPTGVRIATAAGAARYLQYSFAPSTSIINAFLQSLIGLDDYAQVSGDPAAISLFNAGNAEAQLEVPSFDTGAWSLYQPGVEDALSYHTLVTGFLEQLCTLTSAPVYCVTAQHFTADLTTPPVLQQLTARLPAHKATVIRFGLSKMSHVGIVLARGSQTVFLTSAEFPYGVNSFAIPPLSRAGMYTLRLSATDLAGNFARIVGTVSVT